MAPERRGADTRSRILEVSERLFATRGYAGTHLQCIAEEVGVQKTALYHYFESKAALYTAVIEGIVERFEATVGAALSAEAPEQERLERLLDDLGDLFARRAHLAPLLIRIFLDPVPADSELLGKRIRDIVESILVFYRRGSDAGTFARLSSRNAFLSIFGMLLFHYASGRFGAAVLGVDDPLDPDVVAWRRSEVRRLVLHGALPRESGARPDSPERDGAAVGGEPDGRA